MEAKKQTFQEKVWNACKKIPAGKVSTYAGIAKAVGNPAAFRAVGNALNKSPGMPHVPCHRVIKSDGGLGGFAKGAKVKRRLLAREGVLAVHGRVLDLGKRLFKDF
ncbi:MAG: MGMT family protein [Candidatus Diapherotrites archaeon]|nr:MGMT family protein [Candidatus Diapherotrites archaeon]